MLKEEEHRKAVCGRIARPGFDEVCDILMLIIMLRYLCPNFIIRWEGKKDRCNGKDGGIFYCSIIIVQYYNKSILPHFFTGYIMKMKLLYL